jgi:hypothetical protein
MLELEQEEALFEALVDKVREVPSGTELWTWRLVALALADAAAMPAPAGAPGAALAGLTMDAITLDELVEIDRVVRREIFFPEPRLNSEATDALVSDDEGMYLDDSRFRYQVVGLPYNCPYLVRRQATRAWLTQASPFSDLESLEFITHRLDPVSGLPASYRLVLDLIDGLIYQTEPSFDYAEDVVSVRQLSEGELAGLFTALHAAQAFWWKQTDEAAMAANAAAGLSPFGAPLDATGGAGAGAGAGSAAEKHEDAVTTTCWWELICNFTNGTYAAYMRSHPTPPSFPLVFDELCALGFGDVHFLDALEAQF